MKTLKMPFIRKFAIFLLFVFPAVFIWMAFHKAMDLPNFVGWTLAAWILIPFNIWDQKKANSKKAMEEVDNAREQIEKSQLRAALECLEKASAYDPDCFDVRVVRGEIYRNEQAYDKARVELLEAIKINGNSYKAHYTLGLTYLQEKKVFEAVSEFKRTIALKPDYSEVYFILAQAHELAGEKQNAVEAYKKFISKVTPEEKNSKKIADYLERSNARIRVLS